MSRELNLKVTIDYTVKADGLAVNTVNGIGNAHRVVELVEEIASLDGVTVEFVERGSDNE